MTNENQSFMKAYTVTEVSKDIDVPPGTIRQWEKSLEGILNIPRDEKGARYYTEFEITSLRNIKAMRDKGLGFEVIKEVLSQPEGVQHVPVPSVPVMSQLEAVETIQRLTETIENLNVNMKQVIQEEVQREVSKASELLFEQLKRQSEYIDQTIKKRDEQLMAVARELLEPKKELAAQDKKSLVTRVKDFFSKK